ncbi:hypothetical protein [uncultured Brachyspira sp.]|uniref:hypothetical protein n=1 Tax=uncultured Brachyspira sp. TaxID=221953 RepID=UPI0035A8AE1C
MYRLNLTCLPQAPQQRLRLTETYGFAYNVYAEIYITPIKNLEWYFEVEIGGEKSVLPSNLVFNGTTGITCICQRFN